MKLLRVFLFFLSAAAFVAPAFAQTATDMEILRDKIKADKKLLVSENMLLDDKEAKAFWPIYDAYQADLAKINERLGKAIVAYAAKLETVLPAAKVARYLQIANKIRAVVKYELGAHITLVT